MRRDGGSRNRGRAGHARRSAIMAPTVTDDERLEMLKAGDTIREQRAENERLRAKVDRLRMALQPFADCQVGFGSDWMDEDDIAAEPFDGEAHQRGCVAVLFTLKVGQFRRAAAAMAS